jgi:AraC-like DNA-binding protein
VSRSGTIQERTVHPARSYIDPAYYDNSTAALPLARFPIVDTRDPGKALAEATKLFAPHKLDLMHGPAPFRATLNHTRLQRLSFYFIRYWSDVMISSGPPSSYYLVLLPVGGICRVESGSDTYTVAPGFLAVVNPTGALRMRWTGRCTQLVAKVDRHTIDQAVAAHTGQTPASAVSFTPTPLQTDRCPSLAQLFDLILRDLDTASSTIGSRPGEAPAEALFAAMLLRQVPNDHAAILQRPASRAAPYYVKRAEEFAQLHAHRPIRLDDLVAVSGVSARALFAGFRRFRGMGPMAYLKGIRLDRVRESLAAADGANTVSAAARAVGFTHMGNFAKDYRRRFGETPSQTLRRTRL